MPHIPVEQPPAAGAILQLPEAQSLYAKESPETEALKEEKSFLLSFEWHEGHSISSELTDDLW
jgi:hypothetical protein